MVKGKTSQEQQLTKNHQEVLELITTWLAGKHFLTEDIEEAEEIWRQYGLLGSNIHTKSIPTWAAAVIYYLGKKKNYKWLDQAYLAEAFSVSPASISQRWRDLKRLSMRENTDQASGKRNIRQQKQENFDFFTPIAAEVFRKLMTYTQQSEKWKSYVGEVFYHYVGTEAPPLPIDLILELLIFITCDRTLPNGCKIIDYFVVEERFTKEEFSFLQSIRESRFSLFKVKMVEMKNVPWLHVEDLYRDEDLIIMVKKSKGIEEGDIIMSRIIPIKNRGPLHGKWKLGGSLVTLSARAAEELEELAKRWFWKFSIANKGWATGEEFIQENSFLFWRWLLSK
jgi:hypothetical protein